MARIAWETAGTRFYEAGVDRGVLYIDAAAGVPWIGLIGVDENVSGGEAKPYYIDGMKYLNLSSDEEFEATIKAYTYPVEFSQCDGTARIRAGLFFGQQPRKSFGFSYRTLVGNEIEGTSLGYKIHLVYNALATPSARSASSIGDETEPSDFSWNLSTKSRAVGGYKSTAHVIIDSRYTDPKPLGTIEDILYGTDEDVARLPTPEELIYIFDIPLVWSVTEVGEETYLVSGPDENVINLGLGVYTLDHENVVEVDEDTYTVSS